MSYTNHVRTVNGRPVQSPTYRAWSRMIERCRKHRLPITSRWSSAGAGGFGRFLEDLGERPPGTVLRRMSAADPFSPRSCYWAPRGTPVPR